MKALIKIATRLDSTTVCRPPGLPQFARVGWVWMFIVLSSVKTCIKCRLPSSLFFPDSRLLFNESLTAKAPWTLQEYVRSWILCVPKKMQYPQGKKRGETCRIGSAKRQSVDYSIQRLHHVMVSRQSSHSITSYPQQIAVPFAVCIFGGFSEIALAAVTTKNTRMSNRSANTKMV